MSSDLISVRGRKNVSLRNLERRYQAADSWLIGNTERRYVFGIANLLHRRWSLQHQTGRKTLAADFLNSGTDGPAATGAVPVFEHLDVDLAFKAICCLQWRQVHCQSQMAIEVQGLEGHPCWPTRT